jgi:hypothetical protein
MTAVSAKQAGGLRNLYGLGDLNATFKGQAHDWKAEMLRSNLTPAAQKEFDAARAKFSNTNDFLENLAGKNRGANSVRADDVIKRFENIAARKATETARQEQALAQENSARALANKPEFLSRPELQAALAKPKDKAASVRGEIAVEVTRQKLSIDYPAADGYQILKGVKVYEDTGFKTINEWRVQNPGKDGQGLEIRSGQVVRLRTDIDLLVIKRGGDGKPAEIVHLEQIKSGANDKAATAKKQMADSVAAFESGAKGTKIYVETGDGRDIAPQLNLGSVDTARQITRGPEKKEGFDESVGLTTPQMEKIAKEIAK